MEMLNAFIHIKIAEQRKHNSNIRCALIYLQGGTRNTYVMFADGNAMRRRAIQKVALHLIQSGRIFWNILNVRCVLQEKTSFQRLNKNESRTNGCMK